jgi:hypothetical protein
MQQPAIPLNSMAGQLLLVHRPPEATFGRNQEDSEILE